ncbi:MAG TPA: histidine kinase [Cyanobacteria bacterium UBA11372]|nr:histidine kinase [Cyanobacteria bacterium UBA11372]
MVNSRQKTKLTTRKKDRAIELAETIESFASRQNRCFDPVLTPEYAYRLMQQDSDYFNLGQKIIQKMLNSPDPETVLLELPGAIADGFGVEYCLIATIASDAATVETAYWHPGNPVAIQQDRLNPVLSHLVKATMLARKKPLAIADTGAVEIGQSSVDALERKHFAAVLGTTTKFQGQVNGVMLLMRSRPYDWTLQQKEQLLALSDSIAMAISQAQLHRQVRTSLQHQNLLNNLTMAIRSSTDMDLILKLAIDSTARTLGVDRGLILLLKYTDPQLKSHSKERLPRAKVTVACEWSAFDQSQGNQNLGTLLNQSFWLSECVLCQQTFNNSPALTVIADKSDFKDEQTAGIAPIFAQNVMPSLLLVPLESKDTVLGFLVLQQRLPRVWLKEELELVELVSAQLSIAILGSQMQRQILALVEERTTHLQSNLAVQAKWYEKTRQQLEQQRQLNQLKDEFIDTVSHELKTPLTKMRMAIQNLRRPALPADKQARYLDILEQQCNQEINLIQDLLALQQLESKKVRLQVQRVDLKYLIGDLAQSFAATWADKGLTLAVESPERSLMLQTDLDSLTRILQELLTNAGKYSDPETTVNLKVACQVDGQSPQIVVSVSNIGAGISAPEQTQIFEKFRRGQGVTSQAIAGTGLGLALVKSLVQHLNGTIAVSSSPSQQYQDAWETCFTLSLPQM